MKKILSFLFLLSLLTSINPTFSQNKLPFKSVFMIDPRMDLAKLGNNRGDALKIGRSRKAPFVLTSSVYSFDQALNKIVRAPGVKTSALPIDPSTAKFFIFDNETKKFVIVTYNPDVVTFMGPDGEEFIPGSSEIGAISFKVSDFSKGRGIEQFGTETETNENTTANLSNSDREKRVIGVVDIPTNKPKIKIKISKGVVYSIRSVSQDPKDVEIDALGRPLPGPGFENLMVVFDKSDLNIDAGGAFAKANALGNKVLELSKQCNGANQPNFCNSADDEARQALLIKIREIPGFESLPDSGLNLFRNLQFNQ